MGRKERPVDPAQGPVQRFAYELRLLREKAGSPTYRALAARCAYSVTTLSAAASGDRLPSLPVALAYVTACGGDPGEWEARWQEADAAATEELARERGACDATAEPPYRGLARFEPGDEQRFFGRTELTAELLALAAEHRFAALFGPSGSGKSSLLRAGLIPLLRNAPRPPAPREGGTSASGAAGTSGAGTAGTSTSGAGGTSGSGAGGTRASGEAGTPTSGTAGTPASGKSPEPSDDTPAPTPTPVAATPVAPATPDRPAAIRVLTPGAHPVRTHAAAFTPAPGEGDTWVLVDQFEELFTLCRDRAERTAFLQLLLRARDPEHKLRVVIAVRADFYGRCAEHRDLTAALHAAHLLVGPMSPAELRAAIVRPAAAHGLIVERPLTARLLAEVEGEPGGLPLLSHALLETWRRRKGRALTLEAYEAAGGVRGAIAQTAETVYSALTPDQAVLARRVMLRLIAPGDGAQDTRRPVARAELDFGTRGTEVPRILERLAAARLLTLDDGTVDLAHEALITSWPRLRAWIEEDRERLRAHRRLTEAAHAWRDLARDPGALYRGSRLAEADERFAGEPPGKSWPRWATRTLHRARRPHPARTTGHPGTPAAGKPADPCAAPNPRPPADARTAPAPGRSAACTSGDPGTSAEAPASADACTSGDPGTSADAPASADARTSGDPGPPADHDPTPGHDPTADPAPTAGPGAAAKARKPAATRTAAKARKPAATRTAAKNSTAAKNGTAGPKAGAGSPHPPPPVTPRTRNAADADLTPVEREFLAASRAARRAERRRLRAGVVAVCGLLVVALLAGVVAWQQAGTNERQHTESEARRIAAVASGMRMSDPVRAMRLSVAAWRLADTPETRSALFGALAQPEEDAFTLPNGPEADAEHVLSADGRTLVSAGGGRLTRWDVPRHRRLGRAEGPGEGPAGNDPVDTSLSPGGDVLASTDVESRITLYPTGGGPEYRLPGVVGTPVGFSPRGRLLGVSEDVVDDGARTSVQLWDVRRHRRIFSRALRAEQSATLAVSHDERHALVCPDDEAAELWRLDPRRAGGDRRVPLDRWPAKARRAVCAGDRVLFTPGDRGLITMDTAGVRAWKLADGSSRVLAKERFLTDVRLSDDGKLLVAAGSKEIIGWRTDGSRRPVLRYPLVSEYVSDLAIDQRAGVVRYLSGVSGQVVRTVSLNGAHRARWRAQPLGEGTFSPDGRHLATVRLHPPYADFRLRNGRTGAVTERLPRKPCHEDPDADGDPAFSCTALMAFGPAGRTLAYGTSEWAPDGGLRDGFALWDTRAGRVTRKLTLTPGGQDPSLMRDLTALAFTRDGRSLLASRIPEHEHVEVWDTRGGRRTKVLRRVGGESLAVRPKGDLLATSNGQLVNPRTGRVTRRALTQDMTSTVAFSPGGDLLAAGDDSGRVTLWDGRGRRSLGQFAGTYDEGAGGRPEPVRALAFSPDGAMLAVAGGDGTLRLWDTASHQPLGGPLPTARDRPVALAFSPRGHELRYAGAHLPLHRFPTTPARVAAAVCTRAAGGLTPTAWHTALPTTPYRPTCP